MWRNTALKMPSKCSLTPCKLGFGFLRRSNSCIHAVVRFFGHFLPRLQDVGEEREQDAEALSCTYLSEFQQPADATKSEVCYHGMTSLTFDMGRPMWRFRWCISILMLPVCWFMDFMD